eukprot:764412-Hanusia_phi.AAC.1
MYPVSASAAVRPGAGGSLQCDWHPSPGARMRVVSPAAQMFNSSTRPHRSVSMAPLRGGGSDGATAGGPGPGEALPPLSGAGPRLDSGPARPGAAAATAGSAAAEHRDASSKLYSVRCHRGSHGVRSAPIMTQGQLET